MTQKHSLFTFYHYRALKTKHDTPKYGLIYHASLVGQSAPKHKGKISRTLAAKTSLAARVDALGDDSCLTIGIGAKAQVNVTFVLLILSFIYFRLKLVFVNVNNKN